MYVILADGKNLHVENTDEVIINPLLKKTLGGIDIFTFDIAPTHPLYGQLKQMRTVIQIFKGHDLYWTGRVTDTDEENDGVRTIPCEGEISYLIDSIQRPHLEDLNLTGYISYLLEEHNKQVGTEKQIYKGNIFVMDDPEETERSNTEYQTTKAILDGIVGKNDGFLMIRYADGKRYLDYIQDYTEDVMQPIVFGNNLIKVSKQSRGTDIKTVLIPLGAMYGTDRLTIESVNDGKDYIYDAEAMEKYGWISGTLVLDDVDDENKLLEKAKEELIKISKPQFTVTVTAVDLSLIDRSIGEFDVGKQVRVISPPHGLDEKFCINEMTNYLFEPDKGEMVLGDKTIQLSSSFVSGQKEAREYTLGAVENATKLITGGRGGYVVLDPPGGEPERILVMDKPNINEAQTVLQINKNGIGFSTTGIAGPYTNAWTLDGRLVADFITAAELKAGTVGGWKITQDAIYSDVIIGGKTYRAYIQKFLPDNLGGSWIYSVQEKGADGKFYALACIYGDGKIYCQGLEVGGPASIPNISGNINVSGYVIAKGASVSEFKAGITCGGTTAYTGAVFSAIGNGVVSKNLDVLGTFYVAKGSIASSDRRLKDEIKCLDQSQAESFILALNPVEFVYKDDPEMVRHGFIAQDVKMAMNDRNWGVYEDVQIKRPIERGGKEAPPDIVASVRYDEIIADLVKVVQVQRRQIDELDQRIKNMEEKYG